MISQKQTTKSLNTCTHLHAAGGRSTAPLAHWCTVPVEQDSYLSTGTPTHRMLQPELQHTPTQNITQRKEKSMIVQ